jgi:hypothetical protein
MTQTHFSKKDKDDFAMAIETMGIFALFHINDQTGYT